MDTFTLVNFDQYDQEFLTFSNIKSTPEDLYMDDLKETPLRKMTVVRSVHQNRIGCEFRKDQAFEKDLGFYLRA